MNESDDDHELRAGTPEKFWIVGVDDTKNDKTEFTLLALLLSKVEGSKQVKFGPYLSDPQFSLTLSGFSVSMYVKGRQ